MVEDGNRGHQFTAELDNLIIGTFKRFIPHFIVLSIWVSVLVYASFTATVKSPVTVAPTFHIVAASTQCDPISLCSTLDIFQPSCTINSATSVTCGNTTVQAGETYDIVVDVAGGAAGSTHHWTATAASSVVTPDPSGTYTLSNNGTWTFTVKVSTSISISGSDTVTVTVT